MMDANALVVDFAVSTGIDARIADDDFTVVAFGRLVVDCLLQPPAIW